MRKLIEKIKVTEVDVHGIIKAIDNCSNFNIYQIDGTNDYFIKIDE